MIVCLILDEGVMVFGGVFFNGVINCINNWFNVVVSVIFFIMVDVEYLVCVYLVFELVSY